MIQRLKPWLETFPGWEAAPETDTAGLGPGLGIFPRGVETVRREADILGNVTEVCRAVFLLQRLGLGQEEEAQWLLDFPNWVRQQQKLGLAPRFGTDPRRAQITPRGGKWEDAAGGVHRYTVEIAVEYVI